MYSYLCIPQRVRDVRDALQRGDGRQERDDGERRGEELGVRGDRPGGDTEDEEHQARLAGREPDARGDAERLGLCADVRDQRAKDERDEASPEEERVVPV